VKPTVKPNASLQLLPEAGAPAQAVGSQLQGIDND
jgi:hypothetical protein